EHAVRGKGAEPHYRESRQERIPVVRRRESEDERLVHGTRGERPGDEDDPGGALVQAVRREPDQGHLADVTHARRADGCGVDQWHGHVGWPRQAGQGQPRGTGWTQAADPAWAVDSRP